MSWKSVAAELILNSTSVSSMVGPTGISEPGSSHGWSGLPSEMSMYRFPSRPPQATLAMASLRMRIFGSIASVIRTPVSLSSRDLILPTFSPATATGSSGFSPEADGKKTL